uniref:Phosphohistidine phosphatase, SixA n=1 Tax=Cyanothece sp. (strain PCC 7425 / ATCC 29141) TaxID=395961 RepID=B8HKB3_CYAP4
MELYLIRHGIAVERDDFSGPDQDRPLTTKGEQKTRQVANRLRELKLHFELMLTSPYLRARQTAEILQTEDLANQLEVKEFLAHGGRFGDWLTWLEHWQASGGNSLALVGHEPDLSQWAEVLLWEEARQVLTLKKAGIIGLSLPEGGSPVGNSSLFWLSAPKLLL